MPAIGRGPGHVDRCHLILPHASLSLIGSYPIADRQSRILSLGEVKWDRVMDLRHVERLRRARDLLAVKGFDTQHAVLACYSGAGFDRELLAGQRPDIRLVGLDQLYAY